MNAQDLIRYLSDNFDDGDEITLSDLEEVLAP